MEPIAAQINIIKLKMSAIFSKTPVEVAGESSSLISSSAPALFTIRRKLDLEGLSQNSGCVDPRFCWQIEYL